MLAETYVSFIAQFFEIQRALSEAEITSFDMRDSGNLESEFVSGSSGDLGDGEPRRVQPEVSWQEEEPLRPRKIMEADSPSTIRYFLDGTQKTMRACYIDNVPIVAGIVGAGIVERGDDREPHLAPGMTAFKQVWVVPRTSGDSALNKSIPYFEKHGEVVDPLDDRPEDERARLIADFSGMLERGFQRVGKVRQELERDLLRRWHAEIGERSGTILVDGPIRDPVPGAIGIVKSFTRQYLTGEASALLFRLEHGERTAAFSVQDQWRSDTPIVAWYQRHWSAAGRDPRHALVRVEQFAGWEHRPAPSDASAWIMRERLPAARIDARWPTLLYPVHHLERILKRQIDAATKGWSIPE